MKPYSISIIIGIISNVFPEDTSVDVTQPGGDVDTWGLSIGLPGCDDRILLKGFRTDPGHYQGAPGRIEPVDAEMIEFRDTRSDSRGGIQTQNEALAILAARIKVRLLQDGWQVVDSLDPYF
jgi:hypothetical protein